MRTPLLFLLLVFLPLFVIGQTTKQVVDRPALNFQHDAIRSEAGDSIIYEIADVAVSENRSRANSNTIRVSIARIRSLSAHPGNPVMFLAGGPGQSGINYIKQPYFQRLIFQLQQDHDVILLDQRGTGRAAAPLIYKTPEIDKRDIFLDSKKIIEVANVLSRAGADTFKVRNIDIAGYNTVQSADDIESVCRALGVKKLNLLAISYGTHLALATARKFPALIDKMVLIGVSGMNDMHHLPKAYDDQLHRIATLAANDTAVNSHVPDMIELMDRVFTKLDRDPVVVSVMDKRAGKNVQLPVGKFGLQLILRLDVSDSYDFIYFPALFYEMDHGEYGLLQEYVEKRYNQFNSEYTSGIGVMRTASGATRERLALIYAQGKEALLGVSINTPDLYSANFYGAIDLGDDFRKPFKSSVPTLFVSGSMDSNTPVSNAEALQKGFSSSLHLIVEYAGHEDLLPNQQVQESAVKFFRGEMPHVGTLKMPKPSFEPVVVSGVSK